MKEILITTKYKKVIELPDNLVISSKRDRLPSKMKFNPFTAKSPRNKKDKAPAIMQAAVIEAQEKISFTQTAVPQPASNQVRIKVEGCGMDVMDLPFWEGWSKAAYPLAPGAPGHEGWGIVDAIGENVENIQVGNRVAFLSENAFAEYDVARAGDVAVLPKELDHKAFPGKPLGTAMNIFKRCYIEPGQWVAIIGLGFFGCLLTQLIKNAGANVIAVSRRGYSLEMAKKMGADEVVSIKTEESIIQIIADYTGGKLCDRVVEVTGKSRPLNLGGEIVRERGKLIIAGYHNDAPRTINMKLWNDKALDVINAHEKKPDVIVKGMENAIEAVISGYLDPFALYTHIFKFEQLNDAFAALSSRPENYVKGIVLF